MKYYKIIVLGLIVNLCTLEISAQKDIFSSVKAMNGKLFDETEVDIGSWLSFYSWTLVHFGIDAATSLLPDSTCVLPEVWEYINSPSTENLQEWGRYSFKPIGYFQNSCNDAQSEDILESSYLNYCSLLSLPITGISYDQAVLFCKWRTKVQGDNKYLFRLPSPAEWEQFARMNLNGNIKDSLIDNTCPTFNYKGTRCGKNYISGILAIGMYPRAPNRAFELFGNVSEMTSEPGKSKGGNYSLFAYQCAVDSVQYYLKPEAWLGFRCLIEKLDETSKEINLSEQLFKNSNLFIDPRDGQVYPIVKIGDDFWFAKNLSYVPSDGEFWAYRNDITKLEDYGYLYNWETAQNVCPSGWHLPDANEFFELMRNTGYSEEVVYKELLPSGTSNFVVVFGGLRHGRQFTLENRFTGFWTSTEESKKKANSFMLNSLEGKAKNLPGCSRTSGLYVRCIKDNDENNNP